MRARSAEEDFPRGRIVDLSHPFDETTIYWPKAEPLKLPAQGFHVIALPMKIKGGSGGPIRVIAIIP